MVSAKAAGPAAAGAHDPPGPDVRDDLFDDVADLVDLLIELLPPIQELAAAGFLKEMIMLFSDVSIIAGPVALADREKDSVFAGEMIIIATAGDRARDPRQASGNGAGDLRVHSRGLRRPGVQFRMHPP